MAYKFFEINKILLDEMFLKINNYKQKDITK